MGRCTECAVRWEEGGSKFWPGKLATRNNGGGGGGRQMEGRIRQVRMRRRLETGTPKAKRNAGEGQVNYARF